MLSGQGQDMTEQTASGLTAGAKGEPVRTDVAVLWIDWYAYHVARFRGLLATPELRGRVAGIEMVGGIGVHAGLKFREELPPELGVETLIPASSWAEAGQVRLAREVWRALDRLDPRVVLVPGYYTLPALAAAVWARRHGRVSVLMTESTAGDHQRTGWKERLKGWLIRSLFEWAVAGGAPHVRYLEQLGFRPERIARFYDVVDNAAIAAGVQQARRAEMPAEPGLPAGPYFLYVGRLAEEKNLGGLMDAWVKYRSNGGTWPLVLVGDGPMRGELHMLAEAGGHGAAVMFAGLRGSRELPALYAFAGAFVLPSTREPWGLVVNEAMAAGLPVVVSERCGCVEDLVLHGQNGLRFNPWAKGELEHCLHLIESFSPAKRAAMGAASLEQIRAYAPENFGAEIARIVRATQPAAGKGTRGGEGQPDRRRPSRTSAGPAAASGPRERRR